MAGEEKHTGASSAIILAAVVVVVAVYMVTFGLGTLTWAGAKWTASANPWVREVPQPLPAPPVAPQPPEATAKSKSPRHAAAPKDVTLSAYGYEFTTPWAVKYTTTADKHGGTEFRFDSGQIIFVYDPEGQADMLKALTDVTSPQHDKFQTIFAGHAVSTNYALYQAVYGTSPARFSPFMGAQDAIRLNVLLNWKLSYGRDARPGLYSFSFANVRGLQFGNPAQGRAVAVRAFDDHDHQLRLFFTVAGGSNAKLSQDEISSVLASLRIAPLAGS
ncbi:MAG TPA: hypothetical protein VN661_07170 [Candidatus Acidoferrales bacterium]|nr:hypothetical protein [Candidatus Acidoferrales bacterium]